MDEKQEKPQEKPEDTKSDTGEGNDSQGLGVIKDANAAAERLEKATERNEALLKRIEELEANRILGGKSDGGDHTPKVEMSNQEYKDKVLSGEIKPE